MIKYTVLVIALYGICCAIALGQTAPDRPGPGGKAPDGLKRRATPMLRDNGGSLMAENDLNPSTPNRLKYSDVNTMGIPEPKPREIKKHDLVTIIVAEDSQSSSKGTTDLKKNADVDMTVDSYVKLNAGQLAIHGVTPAVSPEIKASGQRDFKGDATVDRQDTMTARIGAEVIDVKPNGVLVLQAKKRISNDEEVQEIILTGQCRAVDVTPDNTVLSTTLQDLDVRKKTKGAAHDTTKRGWVPRLLDFVNPF